MQINITGHHVDVTPALRAYATEKMQKLVRHFDSVLSVNIILNVEKHPANFVVYSQQELARLRLRLTSM